MRKEQYERSELEFIRVRSQDVIMTSGIDDEYEGWNPYDPGAGGGDYEGWNPH